jgi:AraC-like DNA-binding protein
MRVTSIDSRAIRAWYRRLAGVGAKPDPNGAAEASHPTPVRFSGTEGLSGYSDHARADTTSTGDPKHFDCAVLEREIGSLTLSSRLVTPSTVEHSGDGASRGEASIIFALNTLGVSRWATPTRDGLLIPGRMVAVPSVHAVRADAFELSEETSLRVPLRSLGSFGSDLFTMPSLLLPESPLTRAVGTYLTRLLYELSCEPPLDAATSAALEAATLELMTAVTAQLQQGDDESGNRDHKVRAAVTRLIESDYSSPACTVDAIAHALHMSKRQLYRYFSDDDGGIAELLARRRLDAAYELLTQQPDLTIAEVAERCGFGDAGTLRSRFRREFALSPSQLRESHFAGAPEAARS